MTVEEMYSAVKGLMGEKGSSKSFDDNFLPALNITLVDNFDDNNSMRMANGKKPLKEIPQYHTINDEVITYEDKYVLNVIQWGVAAQLETDDDLSKNGIFATKYTNAKTRFNTLISEDVYDALSEGTDI